MRLRHPQPDPSISTKTYRRIISGRTPPAWGTWGMWGTWGTWGTSHPGSADQLKDGQRSSKHSKPEQGNRDVLKRLGFEPVDDVAAVMKGQKGFRAEAEKACKRQPQEEPVWAQLQRPCRQDESCERKRWGDDVEKSDCHGTLGLNFLPDLFQTAGGNEPFQSSIAGPVSQIVSDGCTAKGPNRSDDGINPDRFMRSRGEDDDGNINSKRKSHDNE